ncbi:MAG TPA: serine/threonine-protein kinase, partial [Tetrasphaera sp.]|nr:serine/threonine-protein kinase [Tetrasphaera sp.]
MSEQPAGELPEFTRIGPYRLLQQLGEGGMGVVHLALDRAGRAVAIKVLRPHVAADPAARTRLAREVDTLSRIRHPNVAPIIDHDVEGERPYIVTRYIAGPGLDEVVDDAGPLRGAALLQVGRGLAGALHAIHEAGVIHRDVKPGNILLLDGEPILIDFGIAHVADDVRLTRTGLVMGTPGYLSPEIVEGAAVTDSTDWWGWAATLGFAAQGRPPFGRGSMETILSRVVRGEADLAGVDPDLVPLLEAALSPYPEDRPTDTEVLRALERYAAGGQVTDVLRVVPRREAPGTSAAATPVTELLSGPATAVLPPVAPPPPRVVAPAPAPAREPAAQPSYAGGTAYD